MLSREALSQMTPAQFRALRGQGQSIQPLPREVEGLIGFFVNTLSVRVDLEGGPTAGGLIDQVKQRVLSAQEHQELPFEQVVEAVNPARSLGHAPIFQTMFAWQNNESGELRFGGLDARPVRLPHAVSNRRPSNTSAAACFPVKSKTGIRWS